MSTSLLMEKTSWSCSWQLANIHPQSAYCALTASYVHKFTYVMRTNCNLKQLLKPVKDVIRLKLIPALCKNGDCSSYKRELILLPIQLGGLGIPVLTDFADLQFETSKL